MSSKKEDQPLSTIVWQCAACKRGGMLAHWPTCSACGEFKPQPQAKQK